jgi:hypothetical protein
VHIRELDASDPAARRAWYDVMDRSARADRPHALPDTAMHRTNTALGFRVVEHLYEMEAEVSPLGPDRVPPEGR